LVLASGVLGRPASATGVVGGPLLAGTGVIEHPLAGAAPLPKISADTWLIADLTTGEVLAAKNPHARVRPASTLKTLTSVTLMPELDKNAVHVGTNKDVRVDGSHVGIVSGATYSVWDLWHGLLLPSGNDAAMALANQYGGFDKTVSAMQAMARNLQAHDTHVVNPSGLDADGQLTSAYDMALIAGAAMKIPDFRTVANTKSYAFPGYMPKAGHQRKTFQIYTENRLLRHDYRGIAGGKTGFTSLAHRTFWAAAERNGHMLLVTLFQIHEPTEQAAKELLNWGFNNRTKVSPVGTLVVPLTAIPNTSASAATPSAAASTETLATENSVGTRNIPWAWIALIPLGALTTAFLLRRRAISRRRSARLAGRHTVGTPDATNPPEGLDQRDFAAY
jgi:D-alanyl-D-alanine carboxypeptidase (penicillin-binding protein 5/6)